MDQTVASLSGNINIFNTKSVDLKFLIELGASIGSLGAAFFAWQALHQSNKQKKIEQTPYIVLDHIRRVGSRFGLAVKNLGKGPAMNITFSISEDVSSRNSAFFSDDQPHSANFRTMEESHYWKTDTGVLDSLNIENGYTYLYIFFEDQFRTPYKTKVKIKKIGTIPNHKYIVMENKFEGEAGI